MAKVAALDLGSNTFLCLILERDSLGKIRVLADEVRTVRLGQGLDQSKILHPEALERADNCLKEFRALIDRHQVQVVSAVATSAARDAKNSEELYKICAKYYLPIEIISGPEEAQTSFAGGTFNHLKPQENILVVDIGGGSTELILGNQEELLFAKSYDVGAVRMTERFVTQQPVLDREVISMMESIEKILQPAIAELKKYPIHRILAVAGTPTTLAALENGGQFIEAQIDGQSLALQRLEQWKEIFQKTSLQEKRDRYQLAGRADIIFAGVSILIWIIRALEKEQIYVSTKGVRYGVALRLLQHTGNREK